MLLISGETRAKPTRLQIALWGVTMLLTLYLLFYDWSGYQVGTYGDDGSYVAATDSLLLDGSYGMLLVPGETEPTQFPFVYPMMLAPLRAWFPDNLDALRTVSLVATLALLTVLFWCWDRLGGGLSYWWGLALTAVMALSPITILHGRTVMSEAVFLLFVLLLVFWVEYVVVRSPRAWGILLGVIAVGTVYSRTVGWAFLVPAVAYLIWKMRGTLWRQLGVAVATMAVLLAVTVTTTTVQPVDLLPQEYMAQLSNIFDGRVRRSALVAELSAANQQPPAPAAEFTPVQMAAMFGGGLLNHLDIADKLPFQMEKAVEDATNQLGMPFLRYVPLFGALVVMGLGTLTWLRRTGLTLLFLVAPLYLLMLIIWAWNGSRLIYPLQPQIFLALMLGVDAIAAWVVTRFLRNNQHVRAVALAALLMIWLGIWVWFDLRLSRTMLLPGDQVARAALLQQYIPGDAVVLSARAETDFLYSPQRFVEVPRARFNLSELCAFLTRHQVDYVVTLGSLETTEENESLRIGKMMRLVMNTDLLVKANALVEIYRNTQDDVAIYRVDHQVLDVLQEE